MFNFSATERKAIDQELEPKLEWAKDASAQTQQLALDATRILSCSAERLDQYRDKGFFKRCWYKLSGKTGEIQRANEKDLIAMQKISWRYVNLLQERDLLLAHSLITVKNNLLTLAISEAETRREIERLAIKVSNRFASLEERTKKLESAERINSWLMTLDTHDYEDKYPPYFRLLKVIGDFNQLTETESNCNELRKLQQAVKNVGLPWTDSVSIKEFLERIVDEIDTEGFERYQDLIQLGEDGEIIPPSFIAESIAVPIFVSLAEVANKYAHSTDTIAVLAPELNIRPSDAIKRVMIDFVERQGIDVTVAVPLRDIAIELASCMRLVRVLHNLDRETPEKLVEQESHEGASMRAQSLRLEGNSEADEANRKKQQENPTPSLGEIELSEAQPVHGNSAQELLALGRQQCLSVRPLVFVSEKAFECFSRAQVLGSQEANFWLGFCYEMGVAGQGQTPDKMAALRYYERAERGCSKESLAAFIRRRALESPLLSARKSLTLYPIAFLKSKISDIAGSTKIEDDEVLLIDDLTTWPFGTNGCVLTLSSFCSRHQNGLGFATDLCDVDGVTYRKGVLLGADKIWVGNTPYELVNADRDGNLELFHLLKEYIRKLQECRQGIENGDAKC